ncbi:MFS transporter, partial [Campylobacter jejuni]|nr:MFS transporter [Campylobacter jejuni]
DRGNPRHALVAAVALLTVGLTVTGCAPDMFFFVIGRLLHGLGGGAITVALYAIVARAYPPALHARVFAAFDAAWLLPSLVGPAVAGILAEAIGWRWVFLGAVALV